MRMLGEPLLTANFQCEDGKDLGMHVMLEKANMPYACRQPKSLAKQHVCHLA
jgi:hypothetical protein